MGTLQSLTSQEVSCMGWVHAAETEHAHDSSVTSISGRIGMSEVSG